MTTSRARRRRRRSTPSCSTSTRSTCCSRPTRRCRRRRCMPMVKQRDLLLMGNFSFQVNSKVKHDMWFNNAPWGPADSWAASFLELGQKAGGKTIALLGGRPGIRAEPDAHDPRGRAKKLNMQVVYDQNYPPNTVEFSSILRALNAAKPDIVYVCVVSAGFRRHPARGQRDRRRRQREDLRRRHGRPAVRRGDGEHGLAAQRRRQLQHLAARDRACTSMARRRSSTPMPSARSRPRSIRSATTSRRIGYAMGQMIEQAANATKSLDQKSHRQTSAQERAQDHRRADQLRARRRVEGDGDAAGAVPRRQGQEHRAVPQPRASR